MSFIGNESGILSTAETAGNLINKEAPYPALEVAIGILLIVNVFVGTTGNSMVIAAIYQYSRLQTKTNYLIGSLAVADLLVSIVVVPFAALIVFFGNDETKPWIRNRVFCGVFVFFDVTCCTVSILHLCAIAWVRYKSVSHVRANLRSKRLTSVVPIVVTLWTLASVLSITPFIIFGSVDSTQNKSSELVNSSAEEWAGKPSEIRNNRCIVNTNKAYRVIATTIAFYAPLLAILVIYTRMARIAWNKARGKSYQRGLSDKGISGATTATKGRCWHNNNFQSAFTPSVNEASHAKKLTTTATDSKRTQTEDLSAEEEQIKNTTDNVLQTTSPDALPSIHAENKIAEIEQMSLEYENGTGKMNNSCCEELLSPKTQIEKVETCTYHDKKQDVTTASVNDLSRASQRSALDSVPNSIRLRRERKIILTLGMIIGAFVVCWLPFFVKEIVVPFCDSCHLSFTAEIFINWLGYMNSLINPIIYAYSNKDFNEAFKKMSLTRR